jgi:lysophospholipase L1-like esterase
METFVLDLLTFFASLQNTAFVSFFRGPDVETILQYLADNQIKIFIWSIVIFSLLPFFIQIKTLILNGIINKRLARIATGRPRILNEGQGKKILVLGDSTGYGTGADKVEDTLLGRFAHDFPQVEVNNYAVNGSITNNLLYQLKKVEDKKYNLTIISSGGNDTWRFTNLQSVERDLRIAIAEAKKITGNNVVLIIYNNNASGPVFPFFIRYFILKRTKQVNEIYTKVAKDFDIQAVPIFLPNEKCPANFFSRDGLHPSSEGYRIMYIRLWAELYAHRYDYNLRDY